jgi:hypothetical protein
MLAPMPKTPGSPRACICVDSAALERVLEICREHRTGDTIHVGAIYAAIYIGHRPMTVRDVERGQEIWRELQEATS